MKFFNQFFFRFYQLMISVGNGAIATQAAILFMTLTIWVNIYSIFNLIYVFLNYRIDISFNSKPIIILQTFSITFILYFLFIYKNKYIAISKSFENESKKDRSFGFRVLLFYIILSYLLIIFSFFLMIKRNRGEL